MPCDGRSIHASCACPNTPCSKLSECVPECPECPLLVFYNRAFQDGTSEWNISHFSHFKSDFISLSNLKFQSRSIPTNLSRVIHTGSRVEARETPVEVDSPRRRWEGKKRQPIRAALYDIPHVQQFSFLSHISPRRPTLVLHSSLAFRPNRSHVHRLPSHRSPPNNCSLY